MHIHIPLQEVQFMQIFKICKLIFEKIRNHSREHLTGLGGAI